MLVPHVAQHVDHIHWMEEDLDLLRREVRILAGRVRGLEQGRGYNEMRILHAYDHLEETHSAVYY